MRFISWNVNGLRACMNKGFMDTFRTMDADFFCLQETKLQEGQIQLDLPGYHQYWCYAEKKGYSGTAIFTRHQPRSVSYGLGIPELDTEGRVICLEYDEFYLVTCYTPNAQRGLARIDHRMKWEEAFQSYLKDLDTRKPVVICGDLNVAHKEIDLKNPGSNRGNAGFSDQERDAFTQLLDSGFIDTFRYLHPQKTGAYTWWSYMFNARQNNAGWRIDHFLVSDRLKDPIYAAGIHPEVLGSDHCPVSLDLDTTCNGGLHIPLPQSTVDTDTSKADGDPPIGSVHSKKLALLLPILALALLPVMLLFRKDPAPEPTAPTIKQVTADTDRDDSLIEEILDRTGILGYEEDTPSDLSSSMRQYLVCGQMRWELEGYLINNIYQSTSPNYHLQVVFDTDKRFSSTNRPGVSVVREDSTSAGLTVDRIRYYVEDGAIAGCFISGHAEAPAQLQIHIRWNDITEISRPLTIIPATDGTLITNVELIDGYHFEYDGPFYASAYVPSVWLVRGEERWRMLSGSKGIDLTYDLNASLTVHIEFPETARFTADLKPTITAHLQPNDQDPSIYEKEEFWTRVRFYVDENDRVAGAFIFAYASAEATLQITAQHNSVTEEKTIFLSTDFSSLPTETLAMILVDSPELMFYIQQGGDYLPTMLQESPALRELLSRPYAIDNMIAANGYSSLGTNFDAMLSLDYFQDQMTDLQKLLFQSQQERGIIYGAVLDGDLIFSESLHRSVHP